MSDNNTQAELFAAFEQLGGVVTEMRTGQLISAVGELCLDLHGRGLWEASDAELLEAVWQFRRQYEDAVSSIRVEAQKGPDSQTLAH